MFLSRRTLLLAAAANATMLPALPLRGQESRVRLEAGTRSIDVRGRAANVFRLTQPDGTHGIRLNAGSMFDVDLVNATREEVMIHWHGLTPPVAMDGVPFVSQEPLRPGESHRYRFPVGGPGTHWMHAHHGLQEQLLMAAPLIVADPAAGADVQEVVVMLHDFSFRTPAEILGGLRAGSGAHGAGAAPPAAPHGGGGAHASAGAGHGGAATAPHGAAGDVAYDAYLANDRTLDDPQIVRAPRGQKVRLRLIGAGTATSFVVDLAATGGGELVAVDGQPVAPQRVQSLGLAGGQRADLIVTVPNASRAAPVFFQAEGLRERTGIVLAPPGSSVQRLDSLAPHPAAALDLDLEKRLVAVDGLAPKPAARSLQLTLGEQPGYGWSLDWARDRESAASLHRGERVEITMTNPTSMAHPMHLHGHRFQVVAIGGERRAGAMRDTVLVPAGGSITIAFDADNPGEWPLHCHQLYHMAAGMMTTLRYAG